MEWFKARKLDPDTPYNSKDMVKWMEADFPAQNQRHLDHDILIGTMMFCAKTKSRRPAFGKKKKPNDLA